MGGEIVYEFIDNRVSGANGREQRPQFDALCSYHPRSDVRSSPERRGATMSNVGSILAPAPLRNAQDSQRPAFYAIDALRYYTGELEA